MEERFDKMLCPSCGKEMFEGFTPGAQRPMLVWYPGREKPAMVQFITSIPIAEKCEDFSKGVRFETVGDAFETFFRPAWYCHECGLLVIDTKTKLG